MSAYLLVTVAVSISLSAIQPRSLVTEVQSSTNVAWLERLCNDVAFAEAEYADRGRNTAGVKGVRSAAYVRLGELATPESVAAIPRIEAAHRAQSVLPPAITPGAWSYHPAPHMSDSRWRIDSRTPVSQGFDAAAFVLEFYGAVSLFVATGENGRWGRPYLVLPSVQRDAVVTLRDLGGGRLRAAFSTASAPNQERTTLPFVPGAIEFSLSDVQQDSDGDGWTDIEEQWLDLSWHDPDSDRDRLPDGSDSTPGFQPTGAAVDPVDAAILRRALFAMFGLTGSPHALFVRDQSPRLQLDNLPGPVFYRDARNGVRVTWKVVKRSDAEAVVEITDYEAPLAASGNELRLRRVGDEWYVVSIRMLWIS
jgi:hypothetical protein